MEKDKKLITLKEAAEISGYSSDYIGQLIRSGKIFGEQVHSNVVWKTTADDVLAYKNKSKKITTEKSSFFLEKKRQVSIQIKILKIMFENFKGLLALLFLFFLILFILIFFIINSFFFQRENPTLSPVPDLTNNQAQY